jgi:hypothetical protein
MFVSSSPTGFPRNSFVDSQNTFAYSKIARITDWKATQINAAKTGRWEVTMTKVRIRRVISRTRWQLATFLGKAGRESVGVVDLLAVRKHHGPPLTGTKRGDTLEMILIQVKGGSAAMPTIEDGRRLKLVARQVRARHILLASRKRGSAARFFTYHPRAATRAGEWSEISNLESIFR